VCGANFSAALQVDRIGEYTPGKCRSKAENREQSKETRCGKPHNVILPRRPRKARHTLRLDAQSCYSPGDPAALGPVIAEVILPEKKRAADEAALKFQEFFRRCRQAPDTPGSRR